MKIFRNTNNVWSWLMSLVMLSCIGSVKVHLKNEEGHLIINPENMFLQDVVRYTSAGCGKWKIQTTTDKTGCSSTDNPYIIPLPEYISQIKPADQEHITAAINHMKQIDPEYKEE